MSTNLLWICLGGALVMFMQGGFALVETGFTRKKNAAHTMGMNVAIFGTAFAAFFVVGYALMFGGYSFPNFFCGAIYYPLFGAWTWGGGWLAKLGASANLGHGYVDFAGSGVVHAMGGVAALAGAIVLGPRIGKYGKDGRPQAIPGHNIPMALMGVIILLFGWFGFNGASTLAATGASGSSSPTRRSPRRSERSGRCSTS